MNCKDWEERIALSAGGDLSAESRAEVERHLAACAACRAFAQAVQDSLALLQSAHEEPIAAGHYTALRAAVLERLARERRGRRWAWVPVLAAGLAAAAVFVAVRPAQKPEVTVAELRLPQPPVLAPPALRPVVAPVHARRPKLRPAVATPQPPPEAEPLVVKLITDDPNVVIYWIPDRKGDAQ